MAVLVDSVVAVAAVLRCKQCNSMKSTVHFTKDYRQKSGLKTTCRACAKALFSVYTSTPTGYLRCLVKRTKSNALLKKRTGHTLTYKDFMQILERQQHRCYYSNLPLVFSPYSAFQCSPERLDNALNYTPENTVACILEMNTPLQWSREKAVHAVTHSDSVSEVDVLQNMERVLLRPKKHNFTPSEPASDGKTWRSVFQQLLRSAKCSSSHRAAKGRVDMEFELDLVDMVNMYIAQRGVCAYSGIVLTLRGDWRVSIERINVRRGYSADNVCLVVLEMNCIDRSSTCTDETTEGGWSREKYLFWREQHHKTSTTGTDCTSH
jgi:hypothetical protein